MYRVAQGFPDTQAEIGKKHDKGDMFKGKVARTKWGSSSGFAASYQHGVNDGYWRVLADDADVGVVGGLSPELK
jgi:hypothetical protein